MHPSVHPVAAEWSDPQLCAPSCESQTQLPAPLACRWQHESTTAPGISQVQLADCCIGATSGFAEIKGKLTPVKGKQEG